MNETTPTVCPEPEKLGKKELTADHPTWCPGCGDFSVLACFYKMLERRQLPHENIVTLAGMLIFRGLMIAMLSGRNLGPFPQTFQAISNGYVPDFLAFMASKSVWSCHLVFPLTQNRVGDFVDPLMAAGGMSIEPDAAAGAGQVGHVSLQGEQRREV